MNIREHLKLWQEQHKDEEQEKVSEILDRRQPGTVQNVITRPAQGDVPVDTLNNEESDGLWPEANLGDDGVTEFDNDEGPFMQCGDMVEITLVHELFCREDVG